MAKATGRARSATILVMLAVAGVFLVVSFVVAGFLSELPVKVATGIGLVLTVVALITYVNVSENLSPLHRWRALLVAGSVLAVAPLFALAVQGSWFAEFVIPGPRGSAFELTVADYFRLVTPSGVVLATVGAVKLCSVRGSRGTPRALAK